MRRQFGDRLLQAAGLLALLVAIGTLGLLLVSVAIEGAGRLSWEFLTSYPSRRAAEAGVLPALAGTLFVIGLATAIAVPLGVSAAVFLEEYGGRSRVSRFIEINIANLAGVPSIIYGLLGLALFVRTFGWGRSVLAGSATLALLVLPTIVLVTREALRAVPGSLREAAYALGATKWQAIQTVTLPLALPGIFTGMILAVSRAMGETAPLITIGALTYVPFVPDGVWSPFTVLPIQIFNWVSRPQADFATNAAAAIVVLLAVLLSLNALAIWLRDRRRRQSLT